jgi:hypothetical protein
MQQLQLQNEAIRNRITEKMLREKAGGKPVKAYKLGKKHAKKQLESDLKLMTNQVNNSLKAEFEKSDLFNGKNAVVDAESITEKINKTIEPEAWEDDGIEDL